MEQMVNKKQIIKNLNDCEKEIEIVNNSCIKLTILINEEEGASNIDFDLHKVEYIIQGEGEELQQIKEESINNNINIQKENENGIDGEQEIDNVKSEQGVEEVENGENYNDMQNEEENLEYSEDVERSDKKDNKGVMKRNGNNAKPNNENISNNILNKNQIIKNINLANHLPLNTGQINNQNENGL